MGSFFFLLSQMCGNEVRCFTRFIAELENLQEKQSLHIVFLNYFQDFLALAYDCLVRMNHLAVCYNNL